MGDSLRRANTIKSMPVESQTAVAGVLLRAAFNSIDPDQGHVHPLQGLWTHLDQMMNRVLVRKRHSPTQRRTYELDCDNVLEKVDQMIWYTLCVLRLGGVQLSSADTHPSLLPGRIMDNPQYVDADGIHIFPREMLAYIDSVVTPVLKQ